jgi:hypothetical protein
VKKKQGARIKNQEGMRDTMRERVLTIVGEPFWLLASDVRQWAFLAS